MGGVCAETGAAQKKETPNIIEKRLHKTIPHGVRGITDIANIHQGRAPSFVLITKDGTRLEFTEINRKNGPIPLRPFQGNKSLRRRLEGHRPLRSPLGHRQADAPTWGIPSTWQRKYLDRNQERFSLVNSQMICLLISARIH